MDEERQRFEQWYATHALNHERDPIGSRDCGLQWAAWQAGSESHRAELAECIAALEKIANPISAMKRALPVGATLNGAMATTLSNDPSYLKEIAKAALAARKGEDA